MAVYLVQVSNWKPAKLVRIYTDDKGIEQVEMKWTDRTYWNGYQHSCTVPKAMCKIIRKPTGFEKTVRDFFKKLFKRKK